MGPSGKEVLYGGSFDDVPFLKASGRHWGVYEKGVFNGWHSSEPAADVFLCELDEQVCFSLPYAMKISAHKLPSASIGQTITGKLKSNRKYLISLQVKLDNVVKLKPSASGFCVNLWDDANRWFPQHNWLTGTMDWTHLSFVHTTGEDVSNSKHSYFNLRLMNCSGTAWVDDVSIEELP